MRLKCQPDMLWPGARGSLAFPCVVIPLLGMTYDACVSRELRLRRLNVAGSGFAGRCFRSLGKTEAGRRSASWSRFDDQRPSAGCHDLLNDRQAESGPRFLTVTR